MSRVQLRRRRNAGVRWAGWAGIWLGLLLGGCPAPAPQTADAAGAPKDAAGDAASDLGGTPDAATDAPSPAQATITAVQAALGDHAGFFASLGSTETLGDDSLVALLGQVPNPPTLSEAPDSFGFLTDPAETHQVFQELAATGLEGRIVRVVLATDEGAAGGDLALGLTTSEGALLARRVEGREAKEGFDLPRTPLTPAALKALAFQASLAPDDEDAFEILLLAKPGAVPNLAMTVGAATHPISLTEGAALDLGQGIAAAVGLRAAGQSGCKHRRAVLVGTAYRDAEGVPHGFFGGVLWAGFTHVGYLRGAVGRDEAGKEALIFKLRSLDGAEILHGTADARMNRKLGGTLATEGATAAGWFTARVQAAGTPGADDATPIRLAMTLLTGCSKEDAR